MLNPYAPPESEIRSGISIVSSKIAWKIFFWFMLLLEVFSITSMTTEPEISPFYLYSDIFVYMAILTGIFGYVYDKKIFNKEFWGYLIPVGVSFDTYAIITAGYRQFENIYDMYYVWGFIIVISLPLMTFQYLALYKYRFKSDNIWSKKISI